MRCLADSEIRQFISDGFVKIDAAFQRDLSILWRDTGCDENDSATWTRPVIRLGMYDQEPFARAANTPVLHAAFDQLAGAGRWRPRTDLGPFPIRFPSPEDPGDTGWHVDTSFVPDTGDAADFLDWRVTIRSKAAQMNGQPCIRGMRLTVRRVVEAVASDPNRNDLFRNYSELEPEDIERAQAFAAANLEDSAGETDAA